MNADGEAKVAPEVLHDANFIAECLARQSPDEISKYQPFRTTSVVQFFKDKDGQKGEKPYACRMPVTSQSQPLSNFEGSWSKVTITDVRGHEDLFTLDKDGFEWIRHTSQTNVLELPLDVNSYIREMCAFLIQYCQSQGVFIYDYVQRSPSPSDMTAGFSDVTRRVHCGNMNVAMFLTTANSA